MISQGNSPNCRQLILSAVALIMLANQFFCLQALGQPAAGSSQNSSIIRDPATGRWYRQELVNVQVPVSRWESQPVTQNVLVSSTTTRQVPTQQTVYVPQTDYLIQSKLRGVWNPFRRPTYTYHFQPVTRWTPTTRTVNQPEVRQQWTPQQQTVYVPKLVQRMETQQQLRQTEIAPPAGALYASQPAPLIRIPLLAQQRMLPWQPVRGTIPPAANGLRPATSQRVIPPAVVPTYQAPLRTASANSATGASVRDAMQSGMAATVLR